MLVEIEHWNFLENLNVTRNRTLELSRKLNVIKNRTLEFSRKVNVTRNRTGIF